MRPAPAGYCQILVLYLTVILRDAEPLVPYVARRGMFLALGRNVSVCALRSGI